MVTLTAFLRLSRCKVPARLIEQPLHCPHRDPEKTADANRGDLTAFSSGVRDIARETQIAPSRLRHSHRLGLVRHLVPFEVSQGTIFGSFFLKSSQPVRLSRNHFWFIKPFLVYPHVAP